MKTFLQFMENQTNNLAQVLTYKLARGCQGGGQLVQRKAYECAISTIWTGYEAVKGFGVTEEEWKMAKQQGIIIRDEEGGWKLSQ